MSEPDQRSASIQSIIEGMGAEVRKELDTARAELSSDDYKNFHRQTVAHLNRQLEELIGLRPA